MKTYLTNCILTFDGAPKKQSQVFLDLYVPLEAGEHVCKVFFQGVGDALFPLPTKSGFTPNKESKRKVTLIKVSMCAALPEGMTGQQMDELPALSWFNETNGKIYFK